MKKTLLLSAVLLCCAMGTWAQTVVTAINTAKYYTLECKSSYAHSKNRFISDDGTVVNGQSAEPTLFVFEAADTENGYYIKSVVTNRYINHDGTNISANTTKSTVWTLATTTHTANVVTFTIGSNKYLNNNGSDCVDGSCQYLKANTHANGPQAGNACSLWQMCEYDDVEALDKVAIEAWKNSVLPVLGCVGGYPLAEKSNIEAISTKEAMETFIATKSVVSVDDYTYYRLVCVAPKPGNRGDVTYNTLTYNGDANLVTSPNVVNDANQIFSFEAVEGAETYYLKSLNAGAYLSKIAAGAYRAQVVENADACKITLRNVATAQYELHNSESADSKHCLFAENHPTEAIPYGCSGWSNGANSASAWYIIPVTTFDVDLVEVQGAQYSSLHLPFAVTLNDENVKAYAGKLNDAKDVLNMSNVGRVIPANTPVVLMSEDTMTPSYTLAMGGDVDNSVDNDLQGTLKPITFDETNTLKANYLIFGIYNDDSVGFYAPSSDKISSNKAYLPASLIEQTAQAIKMRFDGDVTGIDATEVLDNAKNAKSPVYDMSGRRVYKMQKGTIYLQGGNKFIAQ